MRFLAKYRFVLNSVSINKNFFSGSIDVNTLFQDMEVLHPCTFSTSSSIFILPIIDHANEIQDFLQLLLHEHPYSGLLVLKLNKEEATMERDNEELYSLIKVSAKSSNIVGDFQAGRK